MRLKTLALAGTILAAPFLASAASAASIIALVDGKTLVTIDPASKKATGKADIKGATNVMGIDVRPADGMLYAVSTDGTIYTVDAKSGQATMKSKISESLKGTITVVDFNPAADRLRVITADGANLRINVDDGKTTVDGQLKYKDGDAMAGKTAKVVAGAYTNSLNPKPAGTALYDIDSAGHLLTQAPPNDGVLNTVGYARREDRRPDRVQHRRLRRRQERRMADGRRHASLGRPQNRQGDGVRQDHRGHRQDHRHRVDGLIRSVGRAVRCPPARLDGPAQQARPAAHAAGRCFVRTSRVRCVRPSPS